MVGADNGGIKIEIQNLNAKKKAIPQNNIPITHLKEFSNAISEILNKIN